MYKILVVATSHKTRGGITSVVNAHMQGKQCKNFNIKWIETHIDKGFFVALWYLLKSYCQFICLLPGARIIHIHLSEPVSAMRKLLYFIPAHLFGKKIISHFHAFSIDTTINGKREWIYRYIFKKSNIVLVLSEFWKQAVNKTFNIDNVEILYNPCVVVVNRKEYRKQKYFLYSGTINERKGYADFIRAFAKIANKHDEWKIVFAGNGDIEKAVRLSYELGIEKRCIFLGWVDGEDKDRVFKEASIFCLPSYAEGFPMAVLDAWAYELPVITTPVGGISDVADNGINMLLFTPGDIDGLAKQMDRLITDKVLYKKITDASKEFSNNKFCIKEIDNRLASIYSSLLKE